MSGIEDILRVPMCTRCGHTYEWGAYGSIWLLSDNTKDRKRVKYNLILGDKKMSIDSLKRKVFVCFPCQHMVLPEDSFHAVIFSYIKRAYDNGEYYDSLASYLTDKYEENEEGY